MISLDNTLEISAPKLHSLVQNEESPLLVDVQSEDDFESWNILHSVNFPLAKLSELEKFPESFSDRRIVTICPSGNKSKTAARILQENGFEAVSLQGGLKEWNKIYDPVQLSIKDSDIEITQFRRIAKGCLSYLITLNGDAAVIDPGHDITIYLDQIENEGRQLKYIFDTHLQADHVSGARQLAEKTGAELLLSDKDPFKFEFTPLGKEESFKLGGKSLVSSIHSPGHTKGSTVYKIKDLGILSGDTVFIDGIGRPDLANRSREFANDLYETINNNIATLPKNMFVAPSHHGKFVLEHFHHPITSDVRTILNNEILNLPKDEFIDYSVTAANSIARPPAYETIVKINSGQLEVTNQEILSLEAGPNRCAIN